jgi:hypothetical protein
LRMPARATRPETSRSRRQRTVTRLPQWMVIGHSRACQGAAPLWPCAAIPQCRKAIEASVQKPDRHGSSL